MSRILALDPGSRRIGLAVSDPTATLAQPLPPVERTGDQDWAEAIAALVAELKVVEIVVGLPRHMDGSEGESSAEARRMAETLRERMHIPVKLWDERLTTVAAERMFRESGVKTQQARKHMDGVAAMLILQGYLDHRRTGGRDFAGSSSE
jgi:putative Holliday junction resolvase